MIWLTLEQLIDLHSDISKHANGLDGVGEINLLESACNEADGYNQLISKNTY